MARFKPVPEPPESLDALSDARRAIPLVPDPEGDCCARLQQRRGLPDRQDAEAWLTFLRALGLVERKQSGYARTRDDLDREALGEALRSRVLGADDAVDAVETAPGPVSAEAVFDEIRETGPGWERRRHDDWEAVWRDRTRRLLEWGDLLGLVLRTDEGFVAGSGDAPVT